MITRRPPDYVMRLKRLGSLHQSRLSFARTLLRRIASEGWQLSVPLFEIDEAGVGSAVYTITGPNRSYSLVAFAHSIPDDLRTDRVIATVWDTTFVLFDGIPTDQDLARLSINVPLQEGGRLSEKELCLSRANRSNRMWQTTLDALSSGNQPDPEALAEVGYLMRTTAVYGSGKFGLADRDMIADRVELNAPFQAEMLCVYLIRTFVRDLIDHIATSRGGVPLDKNSARSLGIGNSTGLGMAPFVINHPVLFNNWIMAREEAIARVRSIEEASPQERKVFKELLARFKRLSDQWSSEHPVQKQKLKGLMTDVALLLQYKLPDVSPWESLMQWAVNSLSEEGQELVASLILEPYPNIVDGLVSMMPDSFEAKFSVDGKMPVQQVKQLIEMSYGWAREVNWDAPENQSRAWYVSEEKLEPRLGERWQEPIADYEQPLQPARDAATALEVLDQFPPSQPIAEVLIRHPDCRSAVRRAQLSAFAPYSEIQDNTISADLMPIDILRAKLSFFGATHFDPRSDRWVRINMFAGAPYPEELTPERAEFWVYPELEK